MPVLLPLFGSVVAVFLVVAGRADVTSGLVYVVGGWKCAVLYCNGSLGP
jgi:hypothetical protein